MEHKRILENATWPNGSALAIAASVLGEASALDRHAPAPLSVLETAAIRQKISRDRLRDYSLGQSLGRRQAEWIAQLRGR